MLLHDEDHAATVATKQLASELVRLYPSPLAVAVVKHASASASVLLRVYLAHSVDSSGTAGEPAIAMPLTATATAADVLPLIEAAVAAGGAGAGYEAAPELIVYTQRTAGQIFHSKLGKAALLLAASV